MSDVKGSVEAEESAVPPLTLLSMLETALFTSSLSLFQHMKSDSATNKYDGWPEMIGLEGCVPKYLE